MEKLNSFQSEVLNRREAAKYLRIGLSTLDKLDLTRIQIRKTYSVSA